MKTEEKFFEIVNVADDGEIQVLQSIFKYTDGGKLKGATGARFYPVSRHRYEEIVRMGDDEIAEHLIDAGFELPDHHKKGGYIEWAAQFDENDKLQLFFDLSYQENWNELREKAGLSEDEAYIFECAGGGRMFDKDFKGNRNDALCEKIRKIEA